MNGKLSIASNQRFRCIQCGRCCRRWHVAVSARDRARLEKLNWPASAEAPEKTFTQIKGHTYLAHTPAGECVFLDTETNLCRIHRHFGESAKPLGCRIYPFNIASTFAGEADRKSVV